MLKLTIGEVNRDVGFTYSMDGKRLSRFVWENDIFTGDYTSYKYGAGFDVLNEVHGSDVKTYVAGLAEAKGTSSSIGTYSYYTHDHLGSTRGAYNESVAKQAKFDYDPFGGAFTTQGGADLTQRFTGHTFDSLSGLYQTPFRAYNTASGRWLQPDPLGMVDGPNMYAYVGGNPVNATDPLGLAAGDWWDPRSYGSVGQELNPFNLNGSFGQAALSMGDAIGGLLTLDGDRINRAYDYGVFGQTENADAWTKYGTRGAVGFSVAAISVAGLALGVEGAAICGYYRVGATVTQRAMNGTRFFSAAQTQTLLQAGRAANSGRGLNLWLTSFRYAQKGRGEVVLKWTKATIIHANPYF